MKSHQFKNCRFEVWPSTGYCQTIFADDSIVRAFPEETTEYGQTSLNLGYGENYKKMCIEHEFLHTYICEKCGLDYSPTLWAVAHPSHEGLLSITLQYEEEAAILAFQKYMNFGHKEEALFKLEEQNNLNLEHLKEEAKFLLAKLYD